VSKGWEVTERKGISFPILANLEDLTERERNEKESQLEGYVIGGRSILCPSIFFIQRDHFADYTPESGVRQSTDYLTSHHQ